MIKITQVRRDLGDVYLTFQYDREGADFTVTLDAREIVERMKQLKQLIGRPLTLQDLRNVVVTMINEIRRGGQPLLETFRYEDYIGVDLEG
jgi:hypothetical protein